VDHSYLAWTGAAVSVDYIERQLDLEFANCQSFEADFAVVEGTGHRHRFAAHILGLRQRLACQIADTVALEGKDRLTGVYRMVLVENWSRKSSRPFQVLVD
jgi:hypothetical protein